MEAGGGNSLLEGGGTACSELYIKLISHRRGNMRHFEVTKMPLWSKAVPSYRDGEYLFLPLSFTRSCSYSASTQSTIFSPETLERQGQLHLACEALQQREQAAS